VQGIGIGGIICNVKNEKNTEGQKIEKKGAMTKKHGHQNFREKKW